MMGKPGDRINILNSQNYILGLSFKLYWVRSTNLMNILQ